MSKSQWGFHEPSNSPSLSLKLGERHENVVVQGRFISVQNLIVWIKYFWVQVLYHLGYKLFLDTNIQFCNGCVSFFQFFFRLWNDAFVFFSKRVLLTPLNMLCNDTFCVFSKKKIPSF